MWQPEYAYQFVPIDAGKTYTLTVNRSGPNASFGQSATTPASFGIDFYDAQWKHLGKVAQSVTGRGGDMSLRVPVPSATAHSSVFLWCDTLRGTDSPFYIQDGCALQKQDDRVSSDTSIMARDLIFLPGPSGTVQGAGIVIVYSDSDGIDATSIDANDAYFVSKTDATKTYPATVKSSRVDDDGRLAFVQYFAANPTHKDFGAVVIRAKQVKDRKGNFAPRKVIGSLTLPTS